MAVDSFTGGYWDTTYSLYDYNLTMKSYIVDKLTNLGCRNVKYIPKSYDKHWMKPLDNIKYKYDVTFVGSYEKERSESLRYLANNGIKIDIWGNGWDSIANIKNLTIHKKPLYKEEMNRLINQSKINMCFLRKLAEDLHTNRTFEIPSMGGFMIAEKTQEQIDFFKEDLEAVYFYNNQELLEKIEYYLNNELKRENIKKNSRKKCIESKYSYEDRYKIFLKEL
jgi:spore maturation protein CgeB